MNLDTIEARVAEAFVEDILVQAGYWVARGGGESQLQTSLEKRLRRYARCPRLQVRLRQGHQCIVCSPWR